MDSFFLRAREKDRVFSAEGKMEKRERETEVQGRLSFSEQEKKIAFFPQKERWRRERDGRCRAGV
jgi:hypothetical protein